MKRTIVLMLLLLGITACDFYSWPALLHDSSVFATVKQGDKPNVLFIAVDDLNDWVGYLGGHPQTQTPNIDALAHEGFYFSNAFTPAPVCGPARTAILTGRYPSSTGVYNQAQWYRLYYPTLVTLPQAFMANGYYVLGSGKIFHGSAIEGATWHEYAPADRTRFVDPQPERLNLNGLNGGLTDWGVLPHPEAETSDAQTVAWAKQQLQRKFNKPFFMAVGIYRPHMPLYVPQEYFDKFPLDSIQLPVVRDDDLDDLSPASFEWKGASHEAIVAHQQWKPAVRAYLASINFADKQIGEVLQALKHSPYADNTIVVLWSDNGMHLGQKKHWAKWTLWDESLRIPFILKVPPQVSPALPQGALQQHTTSPVSLVDIYPTLLQLCGLHLQPQLEGESLLPLLQNPVQHSGRKVLSTFRRNSHSLRSEQWRYIHYADGFEELYDIIKDPHEFDNLARKPQYQAVLGEFRKALPAVNADEVPCGPSLEKSWPCGEQATKPE